MFLSEKWDSLCLVLCLHMQSAVEQLIRRNVVLSQHFCNPNMEPVSYAELHEMLPFLLFHRSVVPQIFQHVLQFGRKKDYEQVIEQEWDSSPTAIDKNAEWLPMYAVLTTICRAYARIPASTKLSVDPAKKATSEVLAQLRQATKRRNEYTDLLQKVTTLESSLAEVRSKQLQTAKERKGMIRNIAIAVDPDPLIEQSSRIKVDLVALQLEEARIVADLEKARAGLAAAIRQQDETWDSLTSSQSQGEHLSDPVLANSNNAELSFISDLYSKTGTPAAVESEGTLFGLVKATFREGLRHIIAHPDATPLHQSELSEYANR